MATTDVRILDNGTARDWVDTLSTRDDLWYVRDALRSVIYTDCFLDVDRAAEGIAACEVVARLKGHGGLHDSSTQAMDAWVEANPQAVPKEVVEMAAEAIDRTLTPESEWPLIWKDEGNDDAWRSALAELRVRVTAPCRSESGSNH